MIEYPKIETLYDRDESFRAKTDTLRKPEFGNIKKWLVQEKIDGMNIRAHFDGNDVVYAGRTDKSDLPQPLLAWLQEHLSVWRVASVFEEGPVTFFGEGYGPKIQKGGNYRETQSFRLFDVLVGRWWLEPSDVSSVADQLGILSVPSYGEMLSEDFPKNREDLSGICPYSLVASVEKGDFNVLPEGIVARPVPMLFNRRGHRVMWKIKYKDFPE